MWHLRLVIITIRPGVEKVKIRNGFTLILNNEDGILMNALLCVCQNDPRSQ